jgi:hypothetical protein
MADVIFDGSDGEMHGANLFGDNFVELIESIEKKGKEVGEIEIWSALFIYGGETSQIRMKVIETLDARKILNKGRRKNGQ